MKFFQYFTSVRFAFRKIFFTYTFNNPFILYHYASLKNLYALLRMLKNLRESHCQYSRNKLFLYDVFANFFFIRRIARY